MSTPKSEYKGVSFTKKNGNVRKSGWLVRYYCSEKKGMKYAGTYPTEREAAIAYDKIMIRLGKPPVNILKPKKDD